MKLLGIECSAVPCSVAVIENGEILASDFSNEGLTHSQTLMPMLEGVLEKAGITLKDIDVLAVARGPGSFTGIRIGISAIKGLAAASKAPCIGVSTLEAMAEGFRDTDCVVCAVMDARCSQVYNGMFDITGGEITRLCEDRALMCDDLAKELERDYNNKKPVVIVGDGARLFYSFVESCDFVTIAQGERIYQNAVSVVKLAERLFKKDYATSPEELLPLYLRLPQAERELKLKKERGK